MTTPFETVREALEAAQNGLKWYRDAHPGDASQADDEMDAEIEEALTALSELERMAVEPVAWTSQIEIDWAKRNPGRAGSFYAVKEGPSSLPLYTAAPPAKQQQYEAGDMASAHNDGFRAGVASVTAGQEPVAWLVCSVNKDGSLSLEYAAAWKEAAHEHINDAITEHGIEEAASWVVRPAYVAAPVAQQPQSTEWLRQMLDELNETDQARWEIGFRNIVAILYGPKHTFEIKDVVERVREIAQQPQAETDDYRAMYLKVRDELAALQQTQQPQAEVGNSGFDHKTAADFLSGKTVSDEAVRKFVQASRWAHDDRASLQSMLLSVRNELASREAEIALLKKELMDADAAPQQAEAVPSDVVRDAEPVYAALRIEGPRFKAARYYGRIYEVLAVGCDKKALTAVAKTAEAAYYDLYYGERTLPKAAYEWVVEQVPTVEAAIAAQGEKP